MSHPLFFEINLKLDQLLTSLNELKVGSKSFLTLSEAAIFLGISKSTLYKHTSAGEIPYNKPNGKIILFRREDLETWINRMRIPARTEF
jgi:excisionase family DNA binding protein